MTENIIPAFQVSRIFSDHMILQRDKNIHVFGEAEDGRKITVTLTGGKELHISRTCTARNGKWLCILPPVHAGFDCMMTVCCEAKEYCFRDIAFGEVWLAGGQSNMEYELQNEKHGAEELKNPPNDSIRFYYTPKLGYIDDAFFQEEQSACWQKFDCKTAGNWSAVGYYFAKKLNHDLGVPVGIIGCNWGGTSASAWMSEEAMLEDVLTRTYVDEYRKAVEGIPVEEQVSAYDQYNEYHTVWDRKCGALYQERPDISWDEVQEILGKCQWPGPMNCKNPFRPAGLYHTMLKRVCPYSMKGFLYYQGESDDHKPDTYYQLFSRLIRLWREDFMDNRMPFLMVQLPMHQYAGDTDRKNWPIIREAQMRVFEELKNTGIAVIIDQGEFNEIHPKDKTEVGSRLEKQALFHVYHELDAGHAFGPIYRTTIYHEKYLELVFDYAERGFCVNGEPEGFEIAGIDGQYVKAKAEMEKDRIFLSADEVPEPKSARYLWTNYASVTVFGANGLPLAPFRTSASDAF